LVIVHVQSRPKSLSPKPPDMAGMVDQATFVTKTPGYSAESLLGWWQGYVMLRPCCDSMGNIQFNKFGLLDHEETATRFQLEICTLKITKTSHAQSWAHKTRVPNPSNLLA
jgi:hypothetical protein